MLLNRDRANAVMDRHGLKGLVVREKHNVYYLTDYWESLSEGGWPFAAFAVLPRDPAAPPTLVIPAISLQRLDLASPTWVENIVAFSDYSGRQAGENGVQTAPDEPPAAPYVGWPTRAGAALSPLAATWSARRDEYGTKVAASPAWALRRALKEAGLSKGRIGTDDLRLTGWMAAMGLEALEPVDAVNVLREIRIVKTEAEIDIMRTGAQANEAACLAAIDAMSEGATWPDLTTVYATEMAKRGARMRYLNTYLGGLPHGKVVRDEPLYFDALGEYQLYLADFGRSAVYGTPSAELETRVAALEAGFRAALDILKPGVRKSRIAETVTHAVHAAGFPAYFNVSPHSLGLEHTDNPMPMGPDTFGENDDFALEENMVINIDMPHVEYGWGAVHIEDTLRITKDGYEPLTSLDTKLIVRG
ncbi:MAG: Xaa-Pro peptidase family protein [Alphaproteobacteria bacterium]